MLVVYALFLICLVLCSAKTPIEDLDILIKKSKFNNPENVFYGAISYKKMGLKFPSDWCDKGVDFKTKDISQLFYSSINFKLMGCEGKHTPEGLVETITSILEKDDPLDHFYATRIILSHGIELESSITKKALSKFVSLFKRNEDILIRAKIVESIVTIGKKIGKKNGAVISATLDIFKFVDSQVKSLTSENSLEEISMFIKAALRLASIMPKKSIFASDIDRISSILQKFYEKIENLKDMSLYIDGMHSIKSNKKYSPLLYKNLEIIESTIQFDVFDVLSLPYIEKDEMTFEIFESNDRDESIFEEAIKRDKNHCIVQLDEETNDKLNTMGVYVFTITSDKRGFKYEEVYKNLGEVDVKKFALLNWEEGVNYRSAIGEDVNFSPKKKKSEPYEVTMRNMQFGVKMSLQIVQGNTRVPFSAEQVFIRLWNDIQDVIFPVKKQKTKGNFKTYFKLSKDKRFKNIAGIYNVEMIVGDAAFAESKQFELGKLDVKFINEKGVIMTDMLHKMSIEEEKYYKKAPIEHIYRAQEKRAPKLMSNIFSGLVFVPFLIFLYGLTYFVGYCSFPPGFIYHVIFQLCIIGALAVCVLFWLKLSVFEAMKYLGIFLVIGVIAGSRGLRKLNQSRKK